MSWTLNFEKIAGPSPPAAGRPIRPFDPEADDPQRPVVASLAVSGRSRAGECPSPATVRAAPTPLRLSSSRRLMPLRSVVARAADGWVKSANSSSSARRGSPAASRTRGDRNRRPRGHSCALLSRAGRRPRRDPSPQELRVARHRWCRVTERMTLYTTCDPTASIFARLRGRSAGGEQRGALEPRSPGHLDESVGRGSRRSFPRRPPPAP